MDEDFERLKSELFMYGIEEIESFLSFDVNPNWDKDAIDKAMDEVHMQMPEEELAKFYQKYNILGA